MNVRHPMGFLHLFSVNNFFYDKMKLRIFYFHVTTAHLLPCCYFGHFEKKDLITQIVCTYSAKDHYLQLLSIYCGKISFLLFASLW